MPPWGWLEWFVLTVTLLPGLLFLPGVGAVRTLTRVAVYMAAPAAGVMVLRQGRPAPWAKGFPARPWLIFAAGWLVLSLLHPNTYTLPAATTQVVYYLAVMAPAFWAGQAMRSSRQVGRVMAVLFLCNALSALVGIGQVYSDRFNPQDIPVLRNVYDGADMKYQLADGRQIVRPCGLTDSPGSATNAGSVAALLGLSFALRPIAAWRRLASLGLAFAGVAVMYFSQVRMSMVMLAICFAVLILLMVLQGNVRGALTGVAGVGCVMGGALAWAARTGGAQVLERFGSLLADDPTKVYQQNRGLFVTDAFFRVLPQYPFGYGMGWWGMVHGMFADPSRASLVWVEVMIPAWVYDGGLFLLVGYGGAVVAAIYSSLRVALTSRDRDLAFWAAVVTAQNLGLAATCFSYVTFLSPLGAQFWLLSAMVYAADAQSRAGTGAGRRRPSHRSRAVGVVA
jgi:hypothetical protein